MLKSDSNLEGGSEMKLGVCALLSATALGWVLGAPALAQDQAGQGQGETQVLDELRVLSAEEQLKQALGVSIITSEDIDRQPPARDLSELIRTQPGVNLTGNTASGQYGQSRQIDLRGMGPENTLILIDGKPVLSRSSTRMGRHGERDTRGDSNWVPPEIIDRIEVIRGPAAARYGSGAAGGVVNIITKRPETANYSITGFVEVPESSKEGGTRRVTANVAGPLSDVFSYRLTANGSWTDPDALDINQQAAEDEGLANIRAGREGVVSYNVSGVLSAKLDEANRLDLDGGWSRQANRFVGGQPSGVVDPDGAGTLPDLARANAETSRLTRTTVSLTHVGDYQFGKANTYIQWEHTANRRLRESNNGGGEAIFNSPDVYQTTLLDNVAAKSEWNIPLTLSANQNLTLGAEYRGEFLKAPISLTPDVRQKEKAHLIGAYIEDNILIGSKLTLTPGVRFDHHSKFGGNFSPSLNGFYAVTGDFTIKAGIARAFKAPNLYQLSPDYSYGSMGNGCPLWYPGQCQIRGNPDLKPEISVNKEIGLAYSDSKGIAASVSYYHNAYKNKITSSETLSQDVPGGANYFNWENSGPATISGVEGNVTIPFTKQISWTTNFTKVIDSEREVFVRMLDGTDGIIKAPVSLVPEYTINNTLRIAPTEKFGITLTSTHYGRIDPTNKGPRAGELDPDTLISRKAYTLVNFGVDGRIDGLKLAAGIDNIFRKRIRATSGSAGNDGANANTFNEPGRTFWLSAGASF